MCGICGVSSTFPMDPAVLRGAITRMSAALAHRGPDDAGIWIDPRGAAALGNRRLAIIDLSPAGHQPMADPRGDVVLTYNGEIYNFQELRAELAGAGYPFRSQSDTEVILALYLRDGISLCHRLQGMFALAIWDGRARHLLLARDRLGIKPLYYARPGGRCVFASEVRALGASGLIPTRLNPAALAAYLRLGSVPAPMTVFEEVWELPPAAVLVVGETGTTLHRYWELPEPVSAPGDPVAAATEIRSRFREAVASHLVSDVPLGVFLSGGTDSSAIVAMMREAGHARIRTFSITFPGTELDEGPASARVAARYGTEHIAWAVRGEDVAAGLDRMIAAMDQPTVDGINTYCVSKAARASGTIVALSGLGGDELFGGYPSFRLAPRLLAWQRMAARLPAGRPVLAAALASMSSSGSAKLKESLSQPPGIRSAYLAVRGLLSQAELSELVAPGPVAEAICGFDAAAALAALAPTMPEDPVAATGILELRGYMHNQLLRDTDTMSMAHGLEVRVPFLDHPLVELAARLPSGLKGNGRPPKWLFLQALKDQLPPEVGPKRGFTFPLSRWLRGPLHPCVEEALADDGGLFRRQALRRLWGRVRAGRAHWSRIWAPVVLILWLRQAGGDLAALQRGQVQSGSA